MLRPLVSEERFQIWLLCERCNLVVVSYNNKRTTSLSLNYISIWLQRGVMNEMVGPDMRKILGTKIGALRGQKLFYIKSCWIIWTFLCLELVRGSGCSKAVVAQRSRDKDVVGPNPAGCWAFSSLLYPIFSASLIRSLRRRRTNDFH